MVLFLHGGISPSVAPLGCREIAMRARRELRENRIADSRREGAASTAGCWGSIPACSGASALAGERIAARGESAVLYR